MESASGPGRDELLEALRRDPGVVLLLDSTDTGKSTLAHYLVQGLEGAGVRKVSYGDIVLEAGAGGAGQDG